ncbi:MAG TPA: TraR/DksA C4-type zinc finger protein [Flavitalea sp.]|nr:TraR/DksA C4-type zinc finger protein [Flavitalea sp.]
MKKSVAVNTDKKNDIKKTEVKKAEVKKPEPVKADIRKPEVKKPEAVIPPPPPPPPVKKVVPPAKPVKVVIPEMKTKTSRRYEPEFTKSVLDQAESIHLGPTMRYSDSELTEFRELIQKKLDQAKKELAYLQGLITRKDEMGGDETENRYMTMEDGSMSMEREQLAQMASRQINYIDHLEKAMVRIENKTYGICRVTGKLIDKARLRAVPHATLSIEAKQTMNR